MSAPPEDFTLILLPLLWPGLLMSCKMLSIPKSSWHQGGTPEPCHAISVPLGLLLSQMFVTTTFKPQPAIPGTEVFSSD